MSFSENEKQWKLSIRKEQNIHIRVVFFVLFCYFWWEICMLRKHTRWGKQNLCTWLWRAAVEASKGSICIFSWFFYCRNVIKEHNLQSPKCPPGGGCYPTTCSVQSWIIIILYQIASALICTLPHRVYLTGTRICEDTEHYSSDPVSSCTSSRALRNYHSQPCGCTKCLIESQRLWI